MIGAGLGGGGAVFFSGAVVAEAGGVCASSMNLSVRLLRFFSVRLSRGTCSGHAVTPSSDRTFHVSNTSATYLIAHRRTHTHAQNTANVNAHTIRRSSVVEAEVVAVAIARYLERVGALLLTR